MHAKTATSDHSVRALERNKNSLVSIDLARAFAAFSVFLYHYGVGHVLANYTGIKIIEWIALPGAVFAVPLFFAISGFCIHGGEWHRYLQSGRFAWRPYLARRFWRIYPVYLVALVFSVAVGGLSKRPVSGWDFAAHLFLLHGFSANYFNTINLVLWTISVECCFYIIYPFWLFVRINKGPAFAFVGGGAVTVAAWIATAIWFYPYSLPAQWFFLNTWIGWLLGALISECLAQGKLLRSTIWWSAGVLAWIIGVFLLVNDVFVGRLLILERPLLMALSLWPLTLLFRCEGLLKKGVAGNKRLIVAAAAIGASSYSLYLLHVPLTEIRYFLESFLNRGSARIALQIGYFFLTLWVCWLSFRQIETRFMRGSRTAPIVSPMRGVTTTADSARIS